MITRHGSTPVVGTMTWTLAEMPLTAHRVYDAQITSANPALVFSATTAISIQPNPAPPGSVSGAGTYLSTGGCVGRFTTDGPVTVTTIDADFSGSDCDPVTGLSVSFSGRVQLTKQ